MTKQANRRAWPWFVLMAAAFLGIAASVGYGFVTSISKLTDSVTYLPLDESMCNPQSEWSNKPMLFLRKGANLAPADVLAGIAARGPDGNPIPIMPQSSTSLDIPAGTFDSIGVLDLSGLGPTDDVCFDVVGLDHSLQANDLMVLEYFVPSVLIAIFKSCAVSIVFAVVFVISIVKAVRTNSSNS